MTLGKPSKLEHGKTLETFPTRNFTKFPTSTGGGGLGEVGNFSQVLQCWSLHQKIIRTRLKQTKKNSIYSCHMYRFARIREVLICPAQLCSGESLPGIVFVLPFRREGFVLRAFSSQVHLILKESIALDRVLPSHFGQ